MFILGKVAADDCTNEGNDASWKAESLEGKFCKSIQVVRLLRCANVILKSREYFWEMTEPFQSTREQKTDASGCDAGQLLDK